MDASWLDVACAVLKLMPGAIALGIELFKKPLMLSAA